MMIASNFTVRRSGSEDEKYYIDYDGVYRLKELSKLLEVSLTKLKEICDSNGGEYSQYYDLFFYRNHEEAKKIVEVLKGVVKPSKKLKELYLTEEEIEYIRKALINEDSNVIFTKQKVRDSIFNKLNS